MEEDIKILENILKTKEYGLCEITDTFYQAIENLLKGYKIEKLRNTLDEQSLKEALDNYIPKSKVKEKIEELNKNELLCKMNFENIKFTIEVLQELMEE